MKRYIVFMVLLFSKCLWGQDNSNWALVGPKSDGSTSYTYTPDRVNCVAVDPRSGYQSYYYAGARGGVWMTNNAGVNWVPMDPNKHMYYGGSQAIAVDPSTGNVYVSSTDQDIPQLTSYGIYELQNPFGVQTWTLLTALPSNCLVHNLQFNPSNNNYLYACTTAGLFLSTNKGSTWTTITTTETFNIVFVVDGSTTYCFATGSSIFLVSTNGTTFTNNSTIVNDITNGGNYTPTMANICVGDISTSNKGLYVFESVSMAAGTTTVSSYEVYQITENGGVISNSGNSMVGCTYSTGNPSTTPYYSYDDGNDTPDRLALGYVQSKGLLFFGGISLNGIDTRNFGCVSAVSVHNDQHYVVDVPSQNTVLEASDGGFSLFNYSGYNYSNSTTWPSFSLMNSSGNYIDNGLDISQVNGFSGNNTDDFYVAGDQDAGSGWTYSVGADVGGAIIGGTEPNGGLIDKFNNNLVIMNNTSYNQGYQYSNDGGTTFNSIWDDICSAGPKYMGGYPVYGDAAGSNFEANLSSPDCEPVLFGHNTFFQDPSRPDKIYYGTSYLNQWDPTQNVFGIKMSPVSIFPDQSWYSMVYSVAISPINPNGFYFATANRYNPPSDLHQSQIIKFIGTNIDNCWGDPSHGETTSNWAEIVPTDLSTISGINPLGTNGNYKYCITAVVISSWNPNKIWAAFSPVPNNPQTKVLQYDNGVWSDYSAGISQNENVVSMAMEIGSNDGIYLGTNRALYYRNATMSSWQTFDNNVPNVIMNQLEFNYNENTIRVGTYGRGIWKSELECPTNTSLTLTTASTYPTANEFDEAASYITSTANVAAATTLSDGSPSMLDYRGGTYVSLQPGFRANPSSNFYAFIHPCSGSGNSFVHAPTRTSSATSSSRPNSLQENYSINVFPNPNAGSFTLRLPENEMSDVHIYNLLGSEIYTNQNQTEQVQIDLSNQPKGIYFVKAINIKTGETDVKKVMVQ